ncbi:sodium/hydrogen exchanger 2-like isoform X3 [Dreissena polymorpha]|nr:sodium/hydrogen exchanger 2-like isoform X3 [Dreissena polymorpha]
MTNSCRASLVLVLTLTFHLVPTATTTSVNPSLVTKVMNSDSTKNSITVVDSNHLPGNELKPGSNNSCTSDGGQGHEGQGHGDKGHDSHPAKIHLVDLNFSHVKGPLLVGLVIIIAGLSKIGFHHADILSSKVPESCILIILGVAFGTIVYFADYDTDFFEPDTFFLYLLPPIILEAAFSLHNRTFVDNLGSIIMFSVVGTVVACFAIGLTLWGLAQAGAMADPGANLVQILVFSSLIVAVDPVAVLAIFQEVGVNNMLYFMVFGESLLNDGVTVVLYKVMQTYNRMDTIEADQILLGIVKFFVVVFGGLLVGVVSGLLSSFITKYTSSVKVVEPIIIFGFAYESYILAEMFHFSGIVSIIGCGLMQMQYALHNITNKSQLCVKFFAKVISNTSEIIIFLFLGLKTVNKRHEWNTGFVLWSLLLCIVYRFIIVFVISFLINRCDKYRVRKIKLDEMFMISYGGLRGAVCFSLVALLDNKEFPMKEMFVTATLFIIFFTVFIQGGTIKFLVKLMRVSLDNSTKDMMMYQELNEHVNDHLMAGIEEIIGVSGKNYIREKFDSLDEKYFRAVLLKDAKKTDFDEMNKYYLKLMMREHYKTLQLCGVSNLPRTDSGLSTVTSSACLKAMDDDDEEKALLRDEELVERRRKRLISQNSMPESQDSDRRDLKMMLRVALNVSQNKTAINFHDKNFTQDSKRNVVGHLRSKHKRNQRLSTLNPVRPTFERALSWNENEGDLVQRRASDVNLKKRAERALTLDCSPIASVTSDPGEFMTPIFELNDTDNVFEAEADGRVVTEQEPLLDAKKHVTFETKEKSGAAEVQKMVKQSEDFHVDNEKKAVKKYASFDTAVPDTRKLADTSNKEISNQGTSKLDGHGSVDQKEARAPLRRGSVLERQNALRDSVTPADIPLEELSLNDLQLDDSKSL